MACPCEEVDVVEGAALEAAECVVGLPQGWAACLWEEVDVVAWADTILEEREEATAETLTAMGLGVMTSVPVRKKMMASGLTRKGMAMVGMDMADMADMADMDTEEVVIRSNRTSESGIRMALTGPGKDPKYDYVCMNMYAISIERTTKSTCKYLW